MTDTTAIYSEEAGLTPDRMALLHTLAFTALRLSLAQLDAFTTCLGEALTAASAQADSPDEAALLRHAFEHLNGRRATFHRLAGDCLRQELLQATEAVAAHVTEGLTSGAMDLSLITFDAMERKVLIDNLSQAVDARNADLLAVLSMRVAHWLRAEELGTAQNPFRSEVFLKAISEAWNKFDLQGASHRLVLRQLRPEVFLQLGPVWQALNQEFVVRKVLPDAEEKYRHRKTLPETLPAPTHIDTLRQWLAPEGTLNVIDARAAQLLEKAFAHIQNQDRIPLAVRALLMHLQPTVSKLVQTDKNFFFDDQHPMRRLLETLIKAGLGCSPDKGSGDSLYQSIERIVMRLQSDQALPSKLLTEVTSDLNKTSMEEERKLGHKLAASTAEAINQENVSRAQQLADADVAVRIATGDVAELLEIFLQKQWTRVLAFAYSVRDTKPDVLPGVIKLMDDLIRGVHPKSSHDARKELVDGLPALLSGLNAWLNVVKWEGEERETFFSTLAEQHAAAMRAPVELTQRAQLEIRMEMMQKASEHELARRIKEQQEAALADFMLLVDRLAPGHWAEFVRNDGSRLNCKLLWISPGRSRFIFTGRQGQLLFTLADDALAHALRAGRVDLIPTEHMVEQALAAALRELSTG